MQTTQEAAVKEEFRDKISTVDKSGKRVWVYPKKPSGKFHNARVIVSIILLGLLFGGPFLKINGKPFLLLNILERKFIILGQVFWPQDFYLFVFALITLAVFIILFTVIYGRLFCGWICPQTIFMEMVFRKIEYWIEGDYKHQQKLNMSPWNAEKILKKSAKHLTFFSISFLIANTFLAYIVGIEELKLIITDPPSEHVGGLTSILAFTGVFYGVFAFFREQVCTTVCPYGRLQGVLLDRNSIVVAYDHVRGESRSKFRKNEDRQTVGKGDCIDCFQCVDVCPTGIDIRNGTQLECVNCTACIDACNFMMDKVGLTRGLIRYASEEGIEKNQKLQFTGRIAAYTAVLFLLIGILGFMLSTRNEIDATVLRIPGMLYQQNDDNTISNLYNVKIINKGGNELHIRLKLEGHSGYIKSVGNQLQFNEDGVAEGAIFIHIEPSSLREMKTKLNIGIYDEDRYIESAETTFIGPS